MLGDPVRETLALILFISLVIFFAIRLFKTPDQIPDTKTEIAKAAAFYGASKLGEQPDELE